MIGIHGDSRTDFPDVDSGCCISSAEYRSARPKPPGWPVVQAQEVIHPEVSPRSAQEDP
jgi:hypothetical protein